MTQRRTYTATTSALLSQAGIGLRRKESEKEYSSFMGSLITSLGVSALPLLSDAAGCEVWDKACKEQQVIRLQNEGKMAEAQLLMAQNQVQAEEQKAKTTRILIYVGAGLAVIITVVVLIFMNKK